MGRRICILLLICIFGIYCYGFWVLSLDYTPVKGCWFLVGSGFGQYLYVFFDFVISLVKKRL